MKNKIIAMILVLATLTVYAGENGQNGRLTDNGSILLAQQLNQNKIDRAILCYFDDAVDGGPKTWSLGLNYDEAMDNLIMPDGSAYHTSNTVCIDRVTSVEIGEDKSLLSISFLHD